MRSEGGKYTFEQEFSLSPTHEKPDKKEEIQNQLMVCLRYEPFNKRQVNIKITENIDIDNSGETYIVTLASELGKKSALSINGQWKRRINNELSELHQRPTIVSVVRAQRLSWLGHINRMIRYKNSYAIPAA